MVSEAHDAKIRPVWLVGASYGGSDDQTSRFLREGRWENGYFDRYIEDVKSVLPGDRIAIKAAYVKWQNLPFDNRGHPVSVMGIKATGTVTENLGDGRNLKVDWTPVDPPREWFFYTYRGHGLASSPGGNGLPTNSLGLSLRTRIRTSMPFATRTTGRTGSATSRNPITGLTGRTSTRNSRTGSLHTGTTADRW